MGSLPTVHVPGSTSNSRKTNKLDTTPQCRNAWQQIWSKKLESKSASSRLEKGLPRRLSECRNSLDHSRLSKGAPRELGNRLLPNERGVNGAISKQLVFREVECRTLWSESDTAYYFRPEDDRQALNVSWSSSRPADRSGGISRTTTWYMSFW